MTDDPTHQRLAANALWLKLRHDEWIGDVSYRRQGDHSGTAGKFKSVATATIARAPSMSDTIRQGHGYAIAAIIRPDDRAGNRTTHLTLRRQTYLEVLRTQPMAAREDWADALRHTPPDLKPYSWERGGRPNDDGERAWYLCKTWDPYLTPGVYAILHALVAAATFPTLIEDDEVPVSSGPSVAPGT